MADYAKNRRDGLVRLINSIVPGGGVKERVVRWAENYSKNLHISTNKESVYRHYDGLIEKFDVVGREDLSRGIEERFERLKGIIEGGGGNGDSILECLALIRELSEDPLGGGVVEFVEEDIPVVGMTWQDIIKDDPLEGDHWNDIESEVETAEEEEEEEEGADNEHRAGVGVGMDIESRITIRKSTASPIPPPESFIHLQEYDINNSLSTIQTLTSYWSRSNLILSDSDYIREVFFSLLGLPSILFEQCVIDKFNHVIVNKNHHSYVVPHLTSQITFSLLEEFCQYSSIMAQLKQYSLIYFVSNKFPNFNYKYILGVLDVIHQKLEMKILNLQDNLQNNKQEQISLVKTLEEVRHLIKPYGMIVTVMKIISVQEIKTTQVALLEELYEKISIYGTTDCYPLVEIFCKLMIDYLRMLKPWFEKGIIVEDNSFPIEYMKSAEIVFESEWNQFTCNNNTISFLSDYNDVMLNAGRAAHVLNQLLPFAHPTLEKITTLLNPPSLESLKSNTNNFPSILHLILHQYFTTIEQNNNTLLYNHLTTENLLKQTLQTHFNIYFMFDYHSSSSFLERLFNRLDEQLPLNKYTVADILEEVWNEPPTIASITTSNSIDFQLLINIPLSNIALKSLFTPSNIQIYQSIWTLLLHCRRLKHHLVTKRSLQSFLFINFLNTYLLYLQETVLKSTTNLLLNETTTQSNFQKVINNHNTKLQLIYKQSLLNTPIQSHLLNLLQHGYDIYYNQSTPNHFHILYSIFLENLQSITNDETIQTLAELLNKS